MDNKLKELGDLYQNKKLELLQYQFKDFIEDEVHHILSGGKIDYDERVKDSLILNNGLNISYTDMLTQLGLGIKELENKKIADIGGGFSALPFILNGKTSDINIIDPIFNHGVKKNLESNKNQIKSHINTHKKHLLKLEKQYYELEFKLNKTKKELERYELELDKYDETNTKEKYIYFSLNKKVNKLKNDYNYIDKNFVDNNRKIERRKVIISNLNKILEELDLWNNLSNNEEKINNSLSIEGLKLGKTNLKLITDIDNYGIEKETCDIILINHVITKSTVNPYELLEKAYDILKVGGKIYITENDLLKIEEGEKIYFNFDLKIYKNIFDNNKTIAILTKK